LSASAAVLRWSWVMCCCAFCLR